MEFTFHRNRIDKIPRQRMLDELEKVANQFNYIEFGKRDFTKYSEIHATTVIREFGSWSKCLDALRKRLQEKNLSLSPRTEPPNRIYSDKQLYEEIERIWKKLGHRPSRLEWENSKPNISYNAIKHRFGGWTNACLRFIEYKMGKSIAAEIDEPKPKNNTKPSEVIPKPEDTRSISLKLRLDVLKRDNFRCVYCGKSPAINLGVVLHIDHIIPFAKGGRSTLNNLQTLCSQCNLGKGDNS